MRIAALISAVALLASSTVALAQTPASSAAAPAAKSHYTTSETEIGVMLDDPAAKAVLVKHLPELATSDQIDMVRSMTLKDVQGLAPDKVTDKALTDIDAELAKLPAKK